MKIPGHPDLIYVGKLNGLNLFVDPQIFTPEELEQVKKEKELWFPPQTQPKTEPSAA